MKFWVIAAKYGPNETRKVIEWGADIDKQNQDGHAAIHYAAGQGKVENVKVLLEHKSNINIRNKWGDSPLHLATQTNRLNVIRFLVESFCDITFRGDEDRTAAEWAKAIGRHPETIEYLAKEAPALQRFVQTPPPRVDGKEHPEHVGAATRAVLRDIYATGHLPIGPCSLIQQFGGPSPLWFPKPTSEEDEGQPSPSALKEDKEQPSSSEGSEECPEEEASTLPG